MIYHLGIDVGTTYTAAAVLRDGRAEIVPLGTRIAEIPSVVFLRDDGEFLIGEAAVRRGATEPGRLAREFKRRLGDTVPILLAGSPQSAQSLTGQILRWVYDTVATREGERPTSTVVTCPANWGPFKRDLLDQAVRLADLPAARTVTEPEAAAVHYASGTRTAPGEVIALYDLGGGTFDAAVLRKTPTGFDLLGQPEGLEHLGGIDFDEAVFSHVVAWLGEAITQLDRTDPAVLAAIARLRRDCVEAKEALSVDTVVSIPVLLPTVRDELRLTRAEFETMIRPALTETVRAMRRGLRSAGFEEGGIKTVVLVGGSSRIPLVAEVVSAEFGLPVAIDAHPKHSIALGAAMLAGAPVVEAPPSDQPAGVASRSPAAAGAVAGAAVAAPPEPAAGGAPPAAGAATLAPPTPVSAAGAGLPPPTAARSAPSAAPPGETPPAPPPAADEPGYVAAPEGRRVPKLALAIAAAAAVVAVIAAVVLLAGGGDGEETGGTTAATSPTSEATSPATIIEPSSSAASSTTRATTTAPTATTVPIPAADAPAADNVILYTSVRNDNWDIFAVNDDGTNERQLTTNPARDMLPAWSPDRLSVAHTREAGDWGIRIISADGGTEIALSDELAADARVAWSPDGTQLAFVSERERTSDLYLLDVRTAELQKLTNDATVEGDPAWSPDGSKLALWRTIDGNTDIWVIEVEETLAAREEGGDEVIGIPLASHPAVDADPAWSPDGTQIAFASQRTGNWDLFVVGYPPVEGDEPTQLTNDPADDQDPAWSPDGSQLAFETKRDGGDNAEIYVMGADGSNPRNVTNRPGLDIHPAWASPSTN